LIKKWKFPFADVNRIAPVWAETVWNYRTEQVGSTILRKPQGTIGMRRDTPLLLPPGPFCHGYRRNAPQASVDAIKQPASGMRLGISQSQRRRRIFPTSEEFSTKLTMCNGLEQVITGRVFYQLLLN
jgi:hypothetical protein